MLERSVAIYLTHLLLCGGALLWVYWQESRGRLSTVPRARLWGMGLLLGALNLAIAEPIDGSFQDFTDAYYKGGVSLLTGKPGFESLFADGIHGFVNLPVLALAFVPFASLPAKVAALVFTGIGLLASGLAVRMICRLASLNHYQTAVFTVLALSNGPLMNSIKEGNTSHFALLALAYALHALRSGSQASAGVVLGLSAVFKLPLLLYGVWALIAGRFRMALAGLAVVLGLVALSVLLFGLPLHLLWFDSAIRESSAHPMATFNVQSFPAALLRLRHYTSTLCNWGGLHYGQALSVVAKILSAATVCVALYGMLKSRKGRSADQALAAGFGLIGLVAVTVSPLSWSHYYCLALLPIALGLPEVIGPQLLPRRDVRSVLWLGSVACLTLPVVWPLACAPEGLAGMVYALVSSHYLFGSCVLIALSAVPAPRSPRGPVGKTVESPRP